MFAVLLAADASKASSIGVFVLLLVFILIISVASLARGGKGYKQLKASYEDTIKQVFNYKTCQGFFTADEFVINVKGSKACSIFKLSDIKTVANCYDRSSRLWNLLVRGEDGKLLKGESSDGKNRKPRKIGIQYPVGQDAADKIILLIIQFAPHVIKADK